MPDTLDMYLEQALSAVGEAQACSTSPAAAAQSLAEAGRLRDEVRKHAADANADVLARLGELELAVSTKSEKLDQPASAAGSPSALPPPPPLLENAPHDEEEADYDRLLEDFLRQGADLRGS